MLLLLAPPRRTPPEDKYPDKAPGLPPPTPRPPTLPPQRPQPPTSSNDDQDTDGKTLVLQPPPPKRDPGKRSRDDEPDPGPSGPKKGELGPDLDQHPVEGSENVSEAEVPTEGGGGDPDQPPKKDALGEGDVEGHPPPRPSPPPALPPPCPPPHNGESGDEEVQGLAHTVASLLAMWENQFNQLVEDIKDDLEDYWRKLMTPQ